MNVLTQVNKLHDLRQLKVDRLLMQAQASHAKVVALQADYTAAQDAYHETCMHNRRSFDQLFKDASNIRDPQSRIVAINRTMQDQQAKVDAARAQIDSVDETLKLARMTRDTANKRVMEAQQKLSGMGVFRDAERIVQTRREEDLADEAAQEQFSSRAHVYRQGPL